jgi:CBS-domain-containing membrane protein
MILLFLSSPLHLFDLGATTLLASLNPEIRHMGWYYLPVILLTSTLALVVALIINNIHRRFPVFWIKHTSPPHHL